MELVSVISFEVCSADSLTLHDNWPFLCFWQTYFSLVALGKIRPTTGKRETLRDKDRTEKHPLSLGID